MLGHALNRFLVESAQHDAVYPALQIVSNVTQLFTSIDSALGLVNEIGSASQASDAGFESEPGSQRGLFKKHDNLLARERPAKIRRTRLHEPGKMKHGSDSLRTEIASRYQIRATECLENQ